jgi:hypothetical protein
MKTKNPLKLAGLLIVFSAIILGGCSGDNVVTDDIAKAVATTFSPLNGGKNTILTLQGSHFGADKSTIRVTINGKDAIIQSLSDEEIVVEVQSGSGSGLVRIYLGVRPNIQVLIYAEEFIYEETVVYETNYKVLPYLGGEISGKTNGTFDVATFLKPRFLQWNADGGLYIVEDDSGLSVVSETEYAGIRVAKDNTVATLLNVDETGTLQRIRAIAFSQDQNTIYIANDRNNSEKPATVGFASMPKTGGDIATLWGTNAGGITFVTVHPITGAVLVGVHSNAWIYDYIDGEFVANSGTVQLLPGSGSGNINGMAFDAAGTTAYIASRSRHVIYKASYDLTTKLFSNMDVFAGTPGTLGYANGEGGDAKFNTPCQIDVDADGNVYVADRGNHCIRKITSNGEVSTYAGTNESGMADGFLADARFNSPEGLQFGPDGALYIADYGNNRIRKIEEVNDIIGSE